jgi:glycerol-1-phosphate dehydrogenase [NAD(P)+]
MDIKKIADQKCRCGEVHQIPIKDIIVKNEALDEITDLLNKITDKKKVYLILDINTKEAAGIKVKRLLQEDGFEVEEILLQKKAEKDHLHPDTDALFKIFAAADNDGYMLACGSGTINDLTAFAAHKMQLPYSVIATAPSMDGYASSVSSITVNGVKQTYNTTPPELIIADLGVLAAAPWEMLQSGLGDLLGKVSSLLEWKLGVVLFDEYFCPEAFDLIKDVLDSLIKNSNAIKKRKESGIKILIDGLINSGIAMMMVGSSRPASGTEHHISHFFDMYAGIYQEEVPSHGIKVGTALTISSYFYLKLLDQDFSDFEFNHDRSERERNIKRVYMDKAPSILELLDKRWEFELISKKHLLEKEAEIKTNIRNFENYLNSVVPILKEFSFFAREDVRNLDRDWLKKAINYSFELRFRYTISTLLNQLGLLGKWGDEAVVELENNFS